MVSVDKVAFGTSCFSIVATVIAFALFIVVLIGLVKRKREPKGSKLFSFYILLILILVAFLVATNRTEYTKHSDISMQSTVNETRLILKNAQKRVEDVAVGDLLKKERDKWFDEKFEPTQLLQDSYQKINFDETKAKIDVFGGLIKRDINITIAHRDMLYELDVWFTVNSWVCRYGFQDRLDEIIEGDNAIIEILYNQTSIYDTMRGRIDEVCAAMENDVVVMKTKDFGVEKIQEDLSKRKTMLLTFQSTIVDNTETVRKQWVDKYTEVLPDKESILKTVIIRTTLVLMLLSFVTLVMMISSNVPQIALSIGMSIMIVTTGMMTIGLCGYTINLYYQFQTTCPLNNDNFGFLNFTSSMCQSPNDTFFQSLTSEMLRFPNIISNYNFQYIIDKRRRKTTDLMQPFVFPKQQFESYFVKMTASSDFIRVVANSRSEMKCRNHEENLKIADKFKDDRNRYTSTMMQCHAVLDDYNQYVSNFPDVLMEIFEKRHNSVLATYTATVDRIQQQTKATDFSCQVFFDKYSKASDTICRPFDGEVTLLWTYLIFIILSFTASIFVHVLVLRNLKSEKNSGALDEQQAPPPPLPTSAPAPPPLAQL